MNIKSRAFVILFMLLTVCRLASGQSFGLSFSYFIPKDGYFSTPISPFSIRGLGFDINRFVAIEAGASLYRMSGLNMKDLPFKSKDPFVGPNFTIFVPVELVFQLKAKSVELDLKGGVFGFYGFSQKLNYGNIDRAIREMEGWEVANSEFSYDNKPGWGYHVGTELTFYLRPDFGVSLEANYLMGSSSLPLSGTYSGGGPDAITMVAADYEDAKIDFTGMEFSIGLIFDTGSQAPKKPNRRRR
jgi:hypothetical protein